MSFGTPRYAETTAYVRMDAGGHTCIVFDQKEKFEVIRMKSGPLEVETLTLQQINAQFPVAPYDVGSGERRDRVGNAAEQYLIHASHAGLEPHAFELLTKWHKPSEALLAQLDAKRSRIPRALRPSDLCDWHKTGKPTWVTEPFRAKNCWLCKDKPADTKTPMQIKAEKKAAGYNRNGCLYPRRKAFDL